MCRRAHPRSKALLSRLKQMTRRDCCQTENRAVGGWALRLPDSLGPQRKLVHYEARHRMDGGLFLSPVPICLDCLLAAMLHMMAVRVPPLRTCSPVWPRARLRGLFLSTIRCRRPPAVLVTARTTSSESPALCNRRSGAAPVRASAYSPDCGINATGKEVDRS
jgi:hypothetical protein